jgi:uncharacterized protein
VTDRSGWGSLGAFVGVVAAANVVRSTLVPGGAHFTYNVALGVTAVALGLRWGLSTTDIGIARSTWRSGLRWGALAAAVVGAVLAVGIVTSVDALAEDARGQIDLPELLLRTLLVIPIGTVVVEELVFRGTLFGLARRVMSQSQAIVVTAGLFGLWHVLPAWRSADGSPAAEALVTLAGTTAAGLAFGWLRARSGSVLAPALAHVATNSGALLAAWLVQR